MRQLNAFRRGLKRDWRRGAGVATSALLGVVLLIGIDSGDWFYHASYDWLLRAKSLLQAAPDIDDVLVVLCDEPTIKVLGEDPIEKSNRQRHAQLVRQLLDRQASAVAFDILFDQPGNGDVEFAQVISNRSVVLAKALRRSSGGKQPIITAPILPVEPIFSAAALQIGWVDFEPDADGVIRRLPRDTNSLAWRVAQLQRRAPAKAEAQRWINYYGKPGTIPSKSYYQILETNFPNELVRNRVVFVGSGPRITHYGSDSDRRLTPYGLMADGVEIQATVTRNLLNQDWVTEPSPAVETFVVVCWGVLCGLSLTGVGLREAPGTMDVSRSPNVRLLRRILWISVLSLAAVGVVAFLLFHLARLWLPWGIVGLAQVPCAAAWAVWIAVVPPKPRYDVFLSHRRAGGAEFARLVRDRLRDEGIRAFVDVVEVEAGKFDEGLLRKIEAAPSFVVIVSAGAFDRCREENDWVRREIAHALKKGKNIVPLVMDGCEMPERRALPEEIADLVSYNRVEYLNQYADAAIKKLVGMVKI